MTVMRAVTTFLMLCGLIASCAGDASRAPAVAHRDEMKPWQAYDASRPQCSSDGESATVSPEVRRRVEPLLEYSRSVGKMPAQRSWESAALALDANYQSLLEEGAAGRSVVRDAVLAESARRPANSFFLLDMGHFLIGKNCADNQAAAAAYRALDPSDPIVRVGSLDLFEFGRAVSLRDLPGTLEAALRAAFIATEDVPIPQHAMSLDPTLQALYLLAPYGSTGEAALAPLLDRETARDRALEVLGWIGSPASVPAIQRALLADHDGDTFERALFFLMTLGGPGGRHLVQTFDEGLLAERERARIGEARGALEQMSFAALRSKIPGPREVKPGRTIRERFSAMIHNQGRDDTFEPRWVLDSDLPATELAEWLRAVRAAQLRRLSNEALSEVKITNALLTALSFRER